MRTTILAYVIAFVGLVMLAVGVWSLLLFETEETVPLADYLTAIGTIAGGLAMGGLAQALRLLLEINRGLWMSLDNGLALACEAVRREEEEDWGR
jgi:hypothetical protein